MVIFVGQNSGSIVQGIPACRQAGNASLYMEEFIVYALESEVDGTIYVGLTKDLNNRVKEHNSGRTKSTKGYRPWNLVFWKSFKTRQEARKQEKYFKTGSGKEKLKELIRLHSSRDTCLPAGREREFLYGKVYSICIGK
jgi:putative endonuclease